MPAINPGFVILVDHANVPTEVLSFQDILQRWIAELENDNSLPETIDVSVRAYGGWFDDWVSSPERYTAAEYYQDNCPAVLRIGSRYLRLAF